MLRSMSVKQLIRWEVYSEIEPWEEERQDYRTASIVASLWNLFGRRRGGKIHSVEDWVMKFGEAHRVDKKEGVKGPARQPWRAQKMLAQAFAEAMNASLKKKQPKKKR